MPRTKYGQKSAPTVVFNKAPIVRGKDSSQYRKDPYGNVMYKASYGKNTPMGWHIDHITPKSRGGSNDIRNLQALNTQVNITKSNTLVKKSRHNQ